MLTGRRPFAGRPDVGVITSILRDQPPPLRSARPDAPAGDRTDRRSARSRRIPRRGIRTRRRCAPSSPPRTRSSRGRPTRRGAGRGAGPRRAAADRRSLVRRVADGAVAPGAVGAQVAIPEIERLPMTRPVADGPPAGPRGRALRARRRAQGPRGLDAFNLPRNRMARRSRSRTTWTSTGRGSRSACRRSASFLFPFGYYRVRISKPGTSRSR